jgi:hypothetical protein
MTGTIHDATGPRARAMGRLDTVKHQLGIEKE